MNIRNIFANIKANEHAVSPVVATFILIIVAVVGAAAVGAMMGVIGEDVGEAADADQVGDATRVMIELGACGCEWDLLRPHVVTFTDATPGVGVLRHDISCQHNPYAVSKGIADVGVMGTCGRAIGFIVQANPGNTILDAFVRVANINNSLYNLTLGIGGGLAGGIDENNTARLHHVFRNATILGAAEGTELHANFTVVNTAVLAHVPFQTNWATYLRGIDVQEFDARIGAEYIYFYTLRDPSPTEQTFINYMRLKVFA